MQKIFQCDGLKWCGTYGDNEKIPNGDAKINKGRFADPQIKGMINDEQYHLQLNELCGNHSKLSAEMLRKIMRQKLL
jgi:hypothetical protein